MDLLVINVVQMSEISHCISAKVFAIVSVFV